MRPLFNSGHLHELDSIRQTKLVLSDHYTCLAFTLTQMGFQELHFCGLERAFDSFVWLHVIRAIPNRATDRLTPLAVSVEVSAFIGVRQAAAIR